MQKAMIICLKSELSGIDIFIVRHDDPASKVKNLAIAAGQMLFVLKRHLSIWKRTKIIMKKG